MSRRLTVNSKFPFGILAVGFSVHYVRIFVLGVKRGAGGSSFSFFINYVVSSCLAI